MNKSRKFENSVYSKYIFILTFDVQILNGEEFPPYLKDVPGVPVRYKSTVSDAHKFALGHEFFGLLPGLFLYATIWLREHNRVCEVLAKEHPAWDDERLFQTAKLVVLGTLLKH